jgi:hypothetical protein
MSRDIIIHYDEAAGKIVCSTVDRALTGPLLANALPLETSIEHFNTLGADEAERSLGAGVFALLDISAKKKIGLRDYKLNSAKIEEEIDADLEQRSRKGDRVAQYELAMQLIAEGLRGKSKKNMALADELLREAAAGGNAEANEYLTELWPSLRARFEHFK